MKLNFIIKKLIAHFDRQKVKKYLEAMVGASHNQVSKLTTDKNVATDVIGVNCKND